MGTMMPQIDKFSKLMSPTHNRHSSEAFSGVTRSMQSGVPIHGGQSSTVASLAGGASTYRASLGGDTHEVSKVQNKHLFESHHKNIVRAANNIQNAKQTYRDFEQDPLVEKKRLGKLQQRGSEFLRKQKKEQINDSLKVGRRRQYTRDSLENVNLASASLSHRDARTFGSVTESSVEGGSKNPSRLNQHSHRKEILQSEVLDKQNKLNELNINRINRYRQEYLHGAGTFDYTKGHSSTKNSIFGQYGNLAEQSISVNSAESRGSHAYTQRASVSLKQDANLQIGRQEIQMDSIQQPNNGLIFIETDHSRASLRQNYANNLAVNKSLNFETMGSEIGQEPKGIAVTTFDSGQQLLETQIIQEAREGEKSIYGLPQIGGPFTSRKVSKNRYFNPHIANNGQTNAPDTFFTDKNGSLGKKKKQMARFEFPGAHSHQVSLTSRVGATPGPVDVSLSAIESSPGGEGMNPFKQDFQLNMPTPVGQVKLPTLVSDIKKSQTSQLNSIHISNASFNSIFKMTKAPFKSPMQHKKIVMMTAQGCNKLNDSAGEIKHPDTMKEEQLTFKAPEEIENTTNPTADAHASASNLLSPSKKDVTINEIKSVRKCDSKMSVLSNRTKMTPMKGRETDLQSQMTKHKNSGLKMNDNVEATIYEVSSDDEPDDITGLNLKDYIIDKDFNGMMILLQELALNRKGSNPIEKKMQEVARECGISLDVLSEDIKRFFDKRAMIDAIQSQKMNGVVDGSNKKCCQVTNKSMEFLKSTGPRNDISGINLRDDGQCNHSETEEDIQISYLDEYAKFLKFSEMLRIKFRQDIPKEVLIKHLTKDINQLKNLTVQERKLFQNEEQVTKLLKNPMLEIVMSVKELNSLREQGEQKCKKELNQEGRIINANKRLLMRRSSLVILKQVSEEVLKDSMTLQRLADMAPDNANGQHLETSQQYHEYMRKHLALSKRETFVDIKKLITTTEAKAEELIQNQLMATNEEMSEEERQKYEIKKLKNRVEIYRIGLIRKFQDDMVKYSLQATKPKKEHIDIQTLTEDEVQDRKYHVTVLDENITERASKFIEKNAEIQKQRMADRQQIMLVREQEAGSDNQSQKSDQSFDDANYNNQDENILDRKKDVCSEIEANTNFYIQAKHEILGYNKPPNQDSIFYNVCKNSNILPQPLFKCVTDNVLRYQGKNMGIGYARALTKFIENNKNIQYHIINLHLDDCCMKDVEFNIILQGILNSKFGVSLQNITYSNNEMGLQSIQRINEFIQLSIVSPQRCLKELCLSNVKIKQTKDLRVLTDCLQEYGDLLTKVKFQKINLNDMEIVQHLCQFLKGNKSIEHLELSGCHLLPKHLVQIMEEFQDNKTLKSLDLSGNSVSDSNENQIKIAHFLQGLVGFISQTEALFSLTLQDMSLGKKVLFLVDYIKQSRSLVEVNLVNNLLTENDQKYICQLLGLTEENQIQKDFVNLMEKYDMCYQNSYTKFKNRHLCEDNKNHDSNDQVVESLINQNISMSIRRDRNLQKKLTLNSQVGEVYAGTVTKDVNLGGKSTTDRLYLRRNIGFNELIFRELGQDIFDQYNFNQPYRWQKVETSQISNHSLKITDSTYLLMYIDLEKIDQEFIKVTDSKTIEILKNQYGLNIFRNVQDEMESSDSEYDVKKLDKNINEQVFDYPLVFGTISNWKVMQMLRTYQFTTILCATSDEDRKNLVEWLFDDLNYSLKADFKNIYANVHKVLNALVQVQKAHVVGNLPNVDAMPQCPDKTTFVYSTLVQPGKHSIYVYVPETDSFYKKIIAVDVSEEFVPRLLPADTVLDQQHITKVGYEIQSQNFEQVDQTLLEAFVIDIGKGNLKIESILEKPKEKMNLIQIIKSLKNHYPQLVVAFTEMQSESQDQYPLISFEYLKSFCAQTNLVSAEVLDSTVTPSKPEDDEMPEEKGRKKKKIMKVDSEFESMNRSQFLKFLIWACKKSGAKLSQFDSFLMKKIVPLVKNSNQMRLREALQNDQEVNSLLEENSGFIDKFYNKYDKKYGLNLSGITQIIIDQALIPISAYNLNKFYALSKQIVINEQAEGNVQYSRMNKEEFIELIYRLADYIYDPKSYKGPEPTQDDEDQEDPLMDVPDDIKNMFEESMYTKFKLILNKILGVKNLELVDEENRDTKQAEIDKAYGGQNHYNVIQYIPKGCVDEYLEYV